MPTALDLELLPEVLALIAEVGIATAITENDGTYDPATGATSGTPTSHTVTATPPLDYDVKFIDGDVVRVGDTYLYVAGSGLGFTPKPGFSVVTGGRTWRVVAVRDLRSGEQTAAWELQLRR